jgi:hypothetical protein
MLLLCLVGGGSPTVAIVCVAAHSSTSPAAAHMRVVTPYCEPLDHTTNDIHPNPTDFSRSLLRSPRSHIHTLHPAQPGGLPQLLSLPDPTSRRRRTQNPFLHQQLLGCAYFCWNSPSRRATALALRFPAVLEFAGFTQRMESLLSRKLLLARKRGVRQPLQRQFRPEL